ncbi:MAG TPA: hypothetical protein VK211_29105 [Kamptonema sp.]|nr:hypothetical protein [Kamptonema sp.]
MNGWSLAFLACCVGLIFISLENERKMEYQRGQIEGLQMQIERSQPNVNVTQNNETNGVKVK